MAIRLLTVAAALVVAPIVFLGAGIAVRDGEAAVPADSSVRTGALATEVATAADLRASVQGQQDRLRRLPEDAAGWSGLAVSYVSLARVAGDPSYYAKAEQALARSLEISPEENADALAGQAALAAARHEFATARELAAQAAALDPYDATTQGVLGDAVLELGDYDAGFAAVQRMVDLRPGVPSYSRVSYSYELRGDQTGARFGLDTALATAVTPADRAFVLYHLGELAFNAGDPQGAAAHFARGLAGSSEDMRLLAGQARAAVALGDTEGALTDYAEVVRRLPEPAIVVEYGELLESLGRVEQAREQYAVADAARALAAVAGGVVPDVEIALYDADHGRPADALATALAQYETRRSVHVEDALAWALHANGRDAEALEHAYAAQRLGIRSALFAYHRGMIEAALGREEMARASLVEALAINPHFSPRQVPIAQAKLAELGGAA